MIKDELIKKLALSVATNGATDKTTNFVLKKLNKTELKAFLAHYRRAVARQSVVITSSESLSLDLEKEIMQMYKDKKLVKNTEENLGAGIKIQLNDIIIDFTVKKYINDTIDKLKL